ncbi:sigma-54-dependent Fis family transcriptional regulator [Endozoicomonas sp. OPT23]|uniref:sigma-54-dependent Fis family transcriptional regulator n=1 Tax=Endozoicomonas sp. OPT23 TaxID=2072845 RepID=UPI00129B21A2|nr:sigma-54-dependent Fis family transcriptional regulator [Endozoicomonas sp. OPT23]MRI34408.1 sigma-54-dependent Fis family transcriptional regulator [Endozoicomonas sp. OPT23]
MIDSQQIQKELIADSWERCRQFGLQQNNIPCFQQPETGTLKELLHNNQLLINTTCNEVLPYYEHILSNSQCLILLTDQQGQVLENWGDKRFLNKDHKAFFQTGIHWPEQLQGTNAIGTALATGKSVQIKRDEHYLKANRYMTGSAAPVFDAERQLIGVLDVSSDSYLPQSHTLGMVKLMTQSVENRLIINKFQKQYFLLSFNTHPETIDSPWAGLLAFNSEGLILAANRRAEHILEMSLLLSDIRRVFDLSLSELKQASSDKPNSWTALEKYQMYTRVCTPADQLSVRQKPSTTITSIKTPNTSSRSGINIDRLEFGDHRVRRAVLQAQKVFEKDIPILVYGETGVGKEVFIKALHQQGSRSDKPLVAVNCAAIPAELIESELFGYEKGAFTGASSQGSIGMIRKAHKGTLFLDEIGDMPLKAQARLLRVLQERQVTPLGSTQAYPVDIKLVSATNRSLKQLVEPGEFRQDLYYRVNGLSVTLPSLRERNDRSRLFQEIHQLHRNPEQPDQLPQEILELFLQHPWPGNIRQLVNVVQVALALSDDDPISKWHLPEDFFDDLGKIDSVEADSHDSTENNDKETLRVFQQHKGNISQTAKILGVSRNTLYKRLKSLGIKQSKI